MLARHRRPVVSAGRRLGIALAALVPLFAAPVIVAAHGIQEQYQSPLPLAVYLVGAALTVGLSFLFVLVRDVRAEPPPEDVQLIRVPAAVRILLRAIGLIAWLWVVAQGVIGGNSDANVGTLFLWVYGWVGIAAVSALIGPVWEWLDPFATLFDIGAAVVRRVGIGGWEPAELPRLLDRWPAVAGYLFFVWLELIEGGGGDILFAVLIAYTAFTLAMMAQYGRNTWRAHGETFSVWFSLLGRLAPFATVQDEESDDPDAIDDTVVKRRPFASGLLDPGWTNADVVFAAVGAGSILYDGLSQTRPWFSLVGRPPLPEATLIMAIFLGIIVGAALVVARMVSPSAIGAGLVPISVGYLLAHYLTYLFVDGQRILIAISDPFQQGSNLFGTAFWVPTTFLPPGLIWTIQLAAVVGGHMLGAWAGHAMAVRDPGRDPGPEVAAERGRSRAGARGTGGRVPVRRDPRAREIPLAIVMVALTTLTLWSLG
ncbi:MAG: hypothetical protein ACJ77N_15495, partial [Chloroflexota bacterium]